MRWEELPSASRYAVDQRLERGIAEVTNHAPHQSRKAARLQSCMDNVTHALAGLMLAECAVRLRVRHEGAEPSRPFRAVASVSSLIAANLPDADLFYTGVGGERLRYMLHHRGYSHTFVAALAGAALVYGGALLVWRWREREGPTAMDSRWLLALLVVSTLSHILLDWTNSYGVHPFWPFDDRWYYGDAVFIVEPWFWVVSVPMLVAASRSRLLQALLSLVLLAGARVARRSCLQRRGDNTHHRCDVLRRPRGRATSTRARSHRGRWLARRHGRDGRGLGKGASDHDPRSARIGSSCAVAGCRGVAAADKRRLHAGDHRRAHREQLSGVDG